MRILPQLVGCGFLESVCLAGISYIAAVDNGPTPYQAYIFRIARVRVPEKRAPQRGTKAFEIVGNRRPTVLRTE